MPQCRGISIHRIVSSARFRRGLLAVRINSCILTVFLSTPCNCDIHRRYQDGSGCLCCYGNRSLAVCNGSHYAVLINDCNPIVGRCIADLGRIITFYNCIDRLCAVYTLQCNGILIQNQVCYCAFCLFDHQIIHDKVSLAKLTALLLSVGIQTKPALSAFGACQRKGKCLRVRLFTDHTCSCLFHVRKQ